MSQHYLESIVPRPTGVTWVCSCGESGIPVADIPGVCSGDERARGAFAFHQALERSKKAAAAPWPFPAASYDYASAGVGSSSVARPVEVDKGEVDQLGKFFDANTARRSKKP